MAETSLHPPDEVYGEYAMANGFDVSNDGREAPFREMLAEEAFVVAVEVAPRSAKAAVDGGVLGDIVGS